MSVYVDKYEFPYGRMKMSHMIADTLTELHAMADSLGLRKWFQDNSSFPHYDVCLSKRAEAIERGAILLDRRDYVLKMREIRQAGHTSASVAPSTSAITVSPVMGNGPFEIAKGLKNDNQKA